ncbi:MAG TPA: transglutaminase-like domain-containing protein [Sedimentisphaerales bacterium]|nr:transglutaminase-like domain-containing protein [Sedimentisphaerales bacterium]
MRVKYILSICLAFAMIVAGCKEEPKTVSEQTKPAVKEAEPVTTETKPVVEEAEPVTTESKPVTKEPKKEVRDETEYYAVFMEGKKVGYVTEDRVVEEPNVITTMQTDITISRLGMAVTMKTLSKNIETAAGAPVGFESVQDLGGVEAKTVGLIDDKGMVNVATSSMGVEQKSTLQWPDGALMAEGLRLLNAKYGLKEGTKYTARIFESTMMQAFDNQIEIGGKKDIDLLGRIVSLTEVITTMTMPLAGTTVTTTYVDDELRMQRSITPVIGMQLEIVACAKEFALGENDVFEMINKMFVKSPAPLGDADAASAITYTLSPIDGAELVIPSTDNQRSQRAEDGRVTLTVQPAGMPVGGTFPYEGQDQTIIEATKPNRYLQSDHEEIIELARKAVGGTKDAGEAARRIEAFVGEFIENKDLSVGYASALEVARSKQGDCSEHAILTSALCRAVGIPAQMVTGVAYVDDWSGMQGFGGHAWVQVYIGRNAGKWVGLDAAFKGAGRGGYGPGHITLAVGNGEPADFFNLATSLGKFKIQEAKVEK